MSKTSVLPAGLTLTGDIEGRGDLIIAGIVEGPIEIEGALTIEESGAVHGDVDVTVLIVRGVLAGNAIARESIRVEPSARMVGDARAPRVQIVEGARVRGRVQMTAEPTPTQARRRRTRRRDGWQGEVQEARRDAPRRDEPRREEPRREEPRREERREEVRRDEPRRDERREEPRRHERRAEELRPSEPADSVRRDTALRPPPPHIPVVPRQKVRRKDRHPLP